MRRASWAFRRAERVRHTGRLMLSAVLVSAAAAVAAQNAPPVVEVNSTDMADLMAEPLGRMGEPVLSDSHSLAGFTRRFRILVIEAFAPSYAVRVDETAAGARLSLVLQERPRDPQSPFTRSTLALSAGERHRLDALLDSRAVRALPREGPTSNDIWVDATFYRFELVDGAGYRSLDRWTALERPLFDLLRLSQRIIARTDATAHGKRHGR